MKYYETHYDEYINAVEKYNLHKDLEEKYSKFPKTLNKMKNMIVYGATGVGKYSQILYILKRYSPSGLKYEKKITIATEKHNHTYHISDIHYEIDMSLLGCNSKILFHEIYSQIVDIVSVKPDKQGIILCKNFHTIHNELLDIFYSYMQQNNLHTNIHLKFILMTEHLSFIPNNVLNCCYTLSIPRPTKTKILEMYKINNTPSKIENKIITEETPRYAFQNVKTPESRKGNPTFFPVARSSRPNIAETLLPTSSGKKAESPFRDSPMERPKGVPSENVFLSEHIQVKRTKKIPIEKATAPVEKDNSNHEQFYNRISTCKNKNIDFTKIKQILDDVSSEYIINNKEINYFSLIKNTEEIPKDNFNIICDNIIQEMINYKNIVMPNFRDVLYDILIYNLDISECVWYILCFFIKKDSLNPETISRLMTKIFIFLKYFQNNYRPIFHLESIFLTMIKEINSI